MKRIIPLLVLLACGARQQGTESLGDSVRSYNDGVRWGRFAIAASLIPAPDRSRFVEEMDERAEDLKITEYDVVKIDRAGERRAKVQIKMSWYKDSEGTLRETHAVQLWERQGKAWLMVDEARLRGAEMPGLAEPLEPDGAEAPEGTAAAATAGPVPVDP